MGVPNGRRKEHQEPDDILRLLAAVHERRAVAVVHIPGHQKGDSAEALGNCRADEAAHRAATCHVFRLQLHQIPLPGMGTLPPSPEYSSSDTQWIERQSGIEKMDSGWYQDPGGWLILPEALGNQILTNLHSSTHLGEKTRVLLEKAKIRILGAKAHIQALLRSCTACQVMQPGQVKETHTGLRLQGHAPGQHWEVDFTEVRPGRYGYWYLLVMVDTFSGWVEAFSTKQWQ